ncbi:MAG: hypothetical protein ACI9UU_001119 [Candidatus Azotimanducaceae bacterium]
MKLLLKATLPLICVFGLWASNATADEHNLYELRTYYANEGKIDALHSRFRDHTITLFEKHGIKNIAYWSPAEQPNTLIYLIAHKSAEAAKASWTAFVQDPEWVKVYQASIADGPLVEKIDSVYMTKTDFSPAR